MTTDIASSSRIYLQEFRFETMCNAGAQVSELTIFQVLALLIYENEAASLIAGTRVV